MARALVFDEHRASEEQRAIERKIREKAALWAHRNEERRERKCNFRRSLLPKVNKCLHLHLSLLRLRTEKQLFNRPGGVFEMH